MNKKTEKNHNLILILEILQRYGAMTQARLKEHCNIQASTTSYLVNDLKSHKLIIDIGQTETEGKVGKPGNLLSLNNSLAQFLGIYVMDKRLDIYLIGIDGSTLNSKTIKYDGLHMEQALYEAIDQELKINSSIKGIGISVKAIVCNDGSIRSSLRNNATDDSTWNFEGLSSSLKRSFPNIVIIIENDANCVAELYHIENQLKNENMVAYLLNNNPFGIGIGIIINGTIYKGSFGAAGEFYAHNSHLRDIADDMCGESDFVSTFIPNILSHALATAYLLNPSCIVVTGSYLENLNSISLDLIEQMFSKVPAPVHIAGGTKSLNPAKGVALLATKQYMVEFVEEVVNN